MLSLDPFTLSSVYQETCLIAEGVLDIMVYSESEIVGTSLKRKITRKQSN